MTSSQQTHRFPSSGELKRFDDVLEYYRYLSDKGDFKAQYYLARIFYDGTKDVPRNFPRALHYFGAIVRAQWSKEGKVLTKGSPASHISGSAAGYLGLMHLRGEGVSSSADRARIWFQRGAEMVPTRHEVSNAG
jgi:SEL1 protein